MGRQIVTIRYEEESVARLDALAAELARRAAGASLSRSEVARIALDRGIAALEAELGMKTKRGKR